MAFDYQAALKDGVPVSAIADHLAQLHDFDIAAARKDGVPDAAIVERLAPITEVGAGKAAARGLGSGLSSLGNILALAASSPVALYDEARQGAANVAGMLGASHDTQTAIAGDHAAADAVMGNVVQPTRDAERFYDPAANEHLGLGAKIGFGLGNLGASLPLMIATGGATAPEVGASVVARTGLGLARGAVAAQPIVVPQAAKEYQDLTDAGMGPGAAARVTAADAATGTGLMMLPLGAPAAVTGKLARAAVGAAVGAPVMAAGVPLGTAVHNLALPVGAQPETYSKSDIEAQGAVGALMGAGFGLMPHGHAATPTAPAPSSPIAEILRQLQTSGQPITPEVRAALTDRADQIQQASTAGQIHPDLQAEHAQIQQVLAANPLPNDSLTNIVANSKATQPLGLPAPLDKVVVVNPDGEAKVVSAANLANEAAQAADARKQALIDKGDLSVPSDIVPDAPPKPAAPLDPIQIGDTTIPAVAKKTPIIVKTTGEAWSADAKGLTQIRRTQTVKGLGDTHTIARVNDGLALVPNEAVAPLPKPVEAPAADVPPVAAAPEVQAEQVQPESQPAPADAAVAAESAQPLAEQPPAQPVAPEVPPTSMAATKEATPPVKPKKGDTVEFNTGKRTGAGKVLAIADNRVTVEGHAGTIHVSKITSVDRPAPAVRSTSKILLDPTRHNIGQAVALYGGLNRAEAEAQGIDRSHFNERGPGGKPIYPKTGGKSFDAMAEALAQDGYPVLEHDGAYSANKLLEAMTRHHAGDKVMTPAGHERIMAEAFAVRQAKLGNDRPLEAITSEEIPGHADANAADRHLHDKFVEAMRAGIEPEVLRRMTHGKDTQETSDILSGLIAGDKDHVREAEKTQQQIQAEYSQSQADRQRHEDSGDAGLPFDAGQPHTGADPEWTRSPARDAGPGLTLEQQTEESLAADAARKHTAAEQAKAEEAKAAAKAAADKERDQFSLSGSDRPADANPGQGDLLGASVRRDNFHDEPSAAQKEAGNYPKEHVKWNGLDISIENQAKTMRRGTDENGKPWETQLAHDYGYVRRTVGGDGEHVDVFMGPHLTSDKVFVVDQTKGEKGAGGFDEHKAMLGFDSKEAALKGYLDSYAKGWDRHSGITEMSVDQFKDWLKNGDTTKPAAASDKSPPPDRHAADIAAALVGVRKGTRIAKLLPEAIKTGRLLHVADGEWRYGPYTGKSAKTALEAAIANRLHDGKTVAELRADLEKDKALSRRIRESLGEQPEENPLPQREAQVAALEKDVPPAEGDGRTVLFKKDNTFYSALQRSVDAMRGAPKKAQASDWKSWLDGAQRRGEFKGSERQWLGVDQWLDEQKGPVSREQVQEFVRQNQVEVSSATSKTTTAAQRDAKAMDMFGKDYESLTVDETKKVREALGGNLSRYADYTLPGGENYREHLLTLPPEDERVRAKLDSVNAKAMDLPPAGARTPDQEQRLKYLMHEHDAIADAPRQGDYASQHYDEPNILAHARTTERTDTAGKKVLFVEEVQSDWHQAGRRQGYGESGVPDAPLKNTDEWSVLAMKQAIRHAVEQGMDKVAWTTGDQQAARYDLSKQIKTLRYSDDTQRSGGYLRAHDKDSNEVISQYIDHPDQLADYVGKDVAAKLLAQEPRYEWMGKVGPRERTLTGQDIRTGGEGMRGFYDNILPKAVQKYIKQWGGKLEPVDIGHGEQQGFTITPAMRESVKEGQPLFKQGEGKGMSATDVQDAIAKPLSKIKADDLSVRVVQSQDELPQYVKDQAGESRVNGVLDVDRRGEATVWMVADNLDSPAHALQTLTHEVIGHLGVQRLMGEDWPALVQRITNLKAVGNAEIKGLADQIAKDYGKLDPSTEAAEIVAHMAEKDAVSSGAQKLWQMIVDGVKRGLARLGLASDKAVGDADIRALLREAARAMRGEGGTGEASLSFAKGRAQFSKEQEDTPAFMRWFGKSKAVDASGKPIVVYHGTSSDVSSFLGKTDKRKLLQKALNAIGAGAGYGNDIFSAFGTEEGRNALERGATWFTDNPVVASDYSSVKKGNAGPNVMPAYVRLERPAIWDAPTKTLVTPNGRKIDLSETFKDDPETSHWTFANPLALSVARKEGGDGVILRGVSDSASEASKDVTSDIYVAFKPDQIKSAIGNNGSFDPTSRNILFKKGTDPVDPNSERAPGESQAEWRARQALTHDDMRQAVLLGKQQQGIGRGLMRAMWAKTERQAERAKAAFEQSTKYFDKLGADASLQAIDDWENGRQIADPVARLFFAAMDQGFKQRIAAVRAVAPDALQNLIHDYFPHLWEDPTKAMKWYQTVLAKRPLEGNKGFLKQRSWGTIKDGMASGLKPVSTNPVDLVMAKMAQMDKFVALHEFRQDLEGRGWLMNMRAGERVPAGYGRVEDSAFQKAAGLQGYYAVPEMIAKDLNNYLSPSLYRFGGFKLLRTVQNTIMSARLGWSAFHAGFTTLDNLITHLDVGSRTMLSGDIGGGLKKIASAPASIFMSPWEGGKLNKMWNGAIQADPQTAAVLDALEQGGARQNMHSSEFNAGIHNLVRSINQKSGTGILKNILPAVGEASSYLIHQKLVPAQKMSARVLLLKYELDAAAEKLDKQKGDYSGIISEMHPDALRQIAGRVVDTVDDRLGHMTYDNQFWNKTARELAQVGIGAVGWQVGTVRTVTGALRDMTHLWAPEKLLAPLDAAGKLTGQNMPQAARLSYLVSLALTMGAAGAVTQYLLTGKGPDEVKDYFFPKTGRRNADDSMERLSFPSYWADHYKLATHPLETAEHKLHPFIGMFLEAVANEDYYGNQIHDTNAPWYTQAEQVAKYVAKGFLPYTATGMQKSAQNGVSAPMMAAQSLGVSPAPSSVTRTPFQDYVARKAFDSMPKGGRTPEQADKSDARRAAEQAIRDGKQPDFTGMTPHDIKMVRKAAMSLAPTARFQHLDLDDKLHAYELATPEERERYKLLPMVNRAIASPEVAPADKRAARERLAGMRG